MFYDSVGLFRGICAISGRTAGVLDRCFPAIFRHPANEFAFEVSSPLCSVIGLDNMSASLASKCLFSKEYLCEFAQSLFYHVAAITLLPLNIISGEGTCCSLEHPFLEVFFFYCPYPDCHVNKRISFFSDYCCIEPVM